jgi:hypothetical protein
MRVYMKVSLPTYLSTYLSLSFSRSPSLSIHYDTKSIANSTHLDSKQDRALDRGSKGTSVEDRGGTLDLLPDALAAVLTLLIYLERESSSSLNPSAIRSSFVLEGSVVRSESLTKKTVEDVHTYRH